MNKKQNIEGLFKSEFENYTQAPSDNVWNGINKQMTGPRIESMYKNAFKGFKIAPTSQTWRRVAAAVWFNRFIHFSPLSFNVYYLGIIITAIVGTIVTVNNNPNLDFVHFSEKYEKVKPLDTKEIFVEQISNEDFELRNTRPNDFELSENSNPDAERMTNSTKTIEYSSKTTQNNVEDLIVSNENQTETSVQNTPLVESTTKSVNNPVDNIESANENIVETTTVATTTETVLNQGETEVANNLVFNLNRLILSNKYTLTYQPTPFDMADLVINGIPKQDVISYDTIGVDYHGDPILKEKSYFALDLYYSPYYHNYNTTLLNSELVSNFDLYKGNIDPQLSFSAGIGFAYSYNKFRLETGIGYQKLHENFYCKTEEYETNTYSQYEYFDDEVWNYTTTFILDLDEFIQGNIVYIQYTDSSMNLVADSTLISITDTTIITKEMYANNSYQLIDVPLVAGYEFNIGKFSITPKAGVISSVLINRNGTYYDLADNHINSTENCPDTKLMFDYYVALNIQYQIGEHAGIYIEPHLRADINSMYEKSYAISQKSRKYGVRTGVYYKF